MDGILKGLHRAANTLTGYIDQLKMIFNPSTGAYKEWADLWASPKFSLKPGIGRLLGNNGFLSIMLAVLNLLPIPASTAAMPRLPSTKWYRDATGWKISWKKPKSSDSLFCWHCRAGQRGRHRPLFGNKTRGIYGSRYSTRIDPLLSFWNPGARSFFRPLGARAGGHPSPVVLCVGLGLRSGAGGLPKP